MKVRLLFQDEPHVEPFLRVKDHLAAHGIELSAVKCNGTQAAERAAQADADLLVIHHELMSDDILGGKRPIAILERIDGGQLAARSWLPNIDGLLKSYSFRDPAMHNRYSGRVSCHKIAALGVTVKNPRAIESEPPQLSDADLAKIHVIYGFGAYARLADLRKQFIDFDAPRPYAVSFRGALNYCETEIEWHRRAAMALGAIGATGATLPHDQYCYEMFLSRCVLSPWGWGEASYRDYEAMLLGAVVIKPDTDYVEGWPDVFNSGYGGSYIACKPDFSNAGQIVSEVSQEWSAFKPMRERARQLAIEAGDDAAIASRLAAVLHVIKERAKR